MKIDVVPLDADRDADNGVCITAQNVPRGHTLLYRVPTDRTRKINQLTRGRACMFSARRADNSPPIVRFVVLGPESLRIPAPHDGRWAARPDTGPIVSPPEHPVTIWVESDVDSIDAVVHVTWRRRP